MTQTLIQSNPPYYLLQVTPLSGKPFYVVDRDGKIISKSFTNKRNAQKFLKIVSRRMLSNSQFSYVINGMFGYHNH